MFLEKPPKKFLIGILLLGFVSGLSFLLTLSTLSFWLSEIGIDNTTIGVFMLVGIPYSVKFLWAPVIDIVYPPILWRWFTKRKSWALISQIGIFLSIIGLSYSNPIEDIYLTALFAFLIALFSSSQDIIIDAYRIEIFSSKNVGVGSALETIGFRLGMLVSGAGTLYIAHWVGWRYSYQIISLTIFMGILAIILMPNSCNKLNNYEKKINFNSILDSWLTMLRKEKFILILGFIFFFKFPDIILSSMTAPFLVSLSFTKIEFANITKLFGITLMILGGGLGGWSIYRFGIILSLKICMIIQTISCLMFVIQSSLGHHLEWLIISIGVESFSSGFTSTTFISYISFFCLSPYTATHFTLIYSISSMFRVFVSMLSGFLADHIGWFSLFFISGFSIFPSILILNKLSYQLNDLKK